MQDGWGFPGGSVIKNLPAIQEPWVRSLGWEDLLEEKMATHSSILAWKIPWTEKPGGLQSTGCKESGTTEHTYTHTRVHARTHTHTRTQEEWHSIESKAADVGDILFQATGDLRLFWKFNFLSRVRLFVTPRAGARQPPLPMGFSRQEYLSGLPFPSPGNLPPPEIEPTCPAAQANLSLSEPPGKIF